MCGIAGLVNFSGQQAKLAEICARMTAVLTHRGPDAEGYWGEGAVALGHRRLSIIDLSPAGAQPMHSACGRWVLIFNGEIYNCEQLRRELAEHPAFCDRVGAWRGHSDTEVLLAAISMLGVEGALCRCVGMFALAAWDKRERSLYLGRDRMGEKPLYYGWLGSTFVFASELKALRRHPDWRGGVDRDVLALYLRHNYIPGPYSIHPGIHKLPPASLLVLAEGGQARLSEYWSLRQVAEAGLQSPWREGGEAAELELERLLRQAVQGQMLSDVALGGLLSGGIDSSSVVALMQAHSQRPIRTFSIGFAESGFDEAPYARAVSRHLGTEHTEVYVSAAEALAVISELPEVYDEPFADSSQIPTLILSRLVRRQVTVALSGDGGDELLGGYDRYSYALRIHRQRTRLPQPVRMLLSRGVRNIGTARWDRLADSSRWAFPKRWARVSNVGAKIHKLADILVDDDPVRLYRGLLSHWSSPNDIVIGGAEKLSVLDGAGEFAVRHGLFNTMLYLDDISYLPDDILVKVDRAGMAASLETRMPFLDHRLIEFAWRLPAEMKLSGTTGKWLLRRVLGKYVPAHLFERPKKGFSIPLGQWLRGPLRDWAEALLAEDRLRAEGFFQVKAVREKWDEHLKGTANWHYLLWDVLVFQAWLERNR